MWVSEAGLAGVWRRLAEPRLVPILAGLALAYVLVVGLGAMLDQRFAGLSLERRVVSDSSYVSHMVNNARFGPADHVLILLGSSVTREAFPSDATLSAWASARFPDHWRVLNLGASSQTIGESIAILSTIDAPPGTIVAFQVTFRRLGYSLGELADELMAPRTASLDYAAVRDMVPFAVQAVHDLTPELLRRRKPYTFYQAQRECDPWAFWFETESSCYGQRAYRRHWYSADQRMSPLQKRFFLRRIEQVAMPRFLANVDDSIIMLRRLLDVAASRSFKLVLVDYPLPPGAWPLERRAENEGKYSERLMALGMPRIDARFSEGFDETDYYDTHHLIGEARARWSRLFLDRLSPLVTQWENAP